MLNSGHGQASFCTRAAYTGKSFYSVAVANGDGFNQDAGIYCGFFVSPAARNDETVFGCAKINEEGFRRNLLPCLCLEDYVGAVAAEIRLLGDALN